MKFVQINDLNAFCEALQEIRKFMFAHFFNREAIELTNHYDNELPQWEISVSLKEFDDIPIVRERIGDETMAKEYNGVLFICSDSSFKEPEVQKKTRVTRKRENK